MTHSPLITVITVVLNAQDVVEQTIHSVINQTYPNVEYIVIDGGSTDGTLDIIKKYEDKITFWKSEPDEGIFDAMNKGIDFASGEWINFMNAGDYFYSDDVLEMIFKDKNIKEDFVFGGCVNNVNVGKYTLSKEVMSPEINDYIWRTPPCHQSSFIRAGIMKQNKFNTKSRLEKEAGDYAKFLDFYYIKKLKFRRENIIVANYLGGGVSSTIVFENPTFSALKIKLDRWKLLSRYLNNHKVHQHYIILMLRTFVLTIALKFMPDYLKYVVFKRCFR